MNACTHPARATNGLASSFVLPVLIAMALGATFTSVSRAQGLLVVTDPAQRVRLPRPILPQPTQPSYKIDELSVDVRLVDQIARVQVSQTFENTGSSTLEAEFVFPLPYDGAVDQLTLLVDGKEYPAKLLSADEARKLYEEIVRKNRDPALLEWIGTGMFRTSVFPIPAGQKRTVTLRYSQICRTDRGLTDFVFPLSTAKYTSRPIDDVKLKVTIESAIEIKNVYSPSYPVNIERPDSNHATVTYTASKSIPRDDFRLFYAVDPGKVGTAVLSYRPTDEDEGFFLLLASPRIEAQAAERPAKTVVFVVDRSGSMSGEKIEQARGALKFVLNNLRSGDLFNIVAYDSEIELFRPELQKFDDETRQAALTFVEGLYAGGSTNIDGALTAALGQLVDNSRPNYVIFLTDGLPTQGEQNEAKIVARTKETNQVRARIFPFGVGFDVNSRLLDKLARVNHGQSEFVQPNENIEDRVSRLYRRIESPVLTDVKIEFVMDEAGNSSPVNRLYPRENYDLFEGEQLVLVGRYRKPGNIQVTISGQVHGARQSYDFTAELVEKSKDDSYAFVEKLWAMRRVGEIIDEIDLKGKNDELVRELVELATRHGILTPYTSFLADDSTNLHETAANATRAGVALEQLSETNGQFGFLQRAAKSSLQNAQMAAPAALGAVGGADGLVRGLPSLHADEEESVVDNVRNLGAKSFYRRANRWVDSTVSEEAEKNAIRLVQFSDDYFKLADQHGREIARYLAFDEPVLVNIEGQTYWIDPATP
ncbi:MAG: VWA domain-containing protein [Pirellulales bacterium]|nr:VWA domain-containing protein [Pirellulales bacterium]